MMWNYITKLTERPATLFSIILLAIILWSGQYIRRDLWAPDEARFALVSKEMREGHWLVPFRQGEFYSHKPPLMFWLTNLFSLATGGEIGNVAPRMPSFLGAVMALWATTRLAARWFSVRASWYVLLFLPSSYLFWNKGGFGQIDMLLCGLEMMALYFLFSAVRWRDFVWAYVFMGLAILAKGPVGLLVPAGVYIAVTLAAKKPFASPKHHFVWGPLLALLFPGAWLFLAWWQGAPDGFFAELLFKQTVGRAAGEFGGHNQPFFYFLCYFPLDFLPWTFLLPVAWKALGSHPETQGGRRSLLAWILFVVFFFSLSASKRNLYILLAYPAAAMLVAASVEHWPKLPETWLRNTFRVLAGVLSVMAVGMIVASWVNRLPFDPRVLLPGGLMLAAGLGWSVRTWRRAPLQPAWIIGMAVSVFLTFTSVGALVYPALNDLKTPDELREVSQAALGPNDRLLIYKLQGEIFSLYAGRKGYMADTDEKFIAFYGSSGQANHLIVAYSNDVPAVLSMIGTRHEPVYFQSGGKKMAYIAVTPVRESFNLSR